MGVLAWVLVCAVVSSLDDGVADSVIAQPLTEDGHGDGPLAEDGHGDGPLAEDGHGDGPLLRNLLEEGRGKKKAKKDIMRLVMAMKVVILSFLIPKVIAVSLYASWKGITISLIALAIATMAALKSSHSGQSEKAHHIIISKKDEDHHRHEHWWRKIRHAEPAYTEENHEGPYHGWHEDYES